ncbi:phosphoribosylamine--glycine ligase N-terminal domain-containing protein, partial [Bacillus altitudinis]|uniref:phosphoribosylamine--glycine ligase N-terminal domain-containing protein n=1 Tax=Bacillus altitudinis TaxID=293387 RepID=UPI001F48B0DA
MKVLIMGRGGREDTMAWKVNESEVVREVFVGAGNDGMREGGKVVGMEEGDDEGLIGFGKENKMGL